MKKVLILIAFAAFIFVGCDDGQKKSGKNNPCNPCAGKQTNPCNPCNPCGGAKGS